MEISQEVLSALIGAVVAFLGSFMLLWRQFREARKLAGIQLLLEFDNRLSVYDKVHVSLRPGGSWEDDQEDPPQGIAWHEVDSYMGAFERLEYFITNEIVDRETAKAFYVYRVQNLVDHEAIRKFKLTDEKENWGNFLKLCEILDIEITKI